MHVAPSSGQMPEQYCRDSSESSINSVKNQAVTRPQVSAAIHPKNVANFRLQWQQLQAKG